MKKKIALLLSGNIRTFFHDSFITAKSYVELANKQDVDIFIYTDNNDFIYDDVQYFSENNDEKILGIPAHYELRYHKKTAFINYEDSHKIIKQNLLNLFNDKLKSFCIDDYDKELIKTIYDEDNINQSTFMNNPYSVSGRKIALMCQFYKLYRCYNLMTEYEDKNNFKYDIIIKSRFDGILNNINNYDLRSIDLDNKIYTQGHASFMNDWWAIGNRSVMSMYCNYYKNISSNMVEGTFCFYNSGWKVVKANNIEEYRKYNEIMEDASDSGEFGLTYLLKYKNKYDLFYNHKIHIDIRSKFFKK